jgi:hypothetical protein
MRGWHRDVNAGVKTDPDYPLGQFRGSGVTKALRECNVAVGNVPGVLVERVAAQLRRFEESLSRRLMELDAESPGDVSESAALLRVVELASFGHGEWVRIHPFAGGNGRTARILSNWILVRYGLPPVVRLRPRPDSIDYANASERSMAMSDHRLMQRYIVDQLSRQFG